MYVLDEEKQIVSGTWEGYLDHEKVNNGSIMIYTGPKMTGQRVTGYSVVKDGQKTKLRVSGANGTIFITYETSAVIIPVVTVVESLPQPVDDGPKADRLYVEAELAKKADKSNTFTKKEITDRLAQVVGQKGEKGDTGPQGEIGPTGPKGERGPQGIQGFKGDKGDTGPQGIQGPKGDTGLTGAKGDIGPQGAKGNDGYTPVKGIDYFDGAKGDTGERGPQGLKGDIGPQGDKGDIGIQGPIGLTGAKGDKGDTGPQGLQGIQGERGLQGLKGDKGDAGSIGPKGDKGDKGNPFVYSDFTTIQLEGLRGPQGIQGPKGDKGDKGDTGEKGPPGESVADSVEWSKVLNKPTTFAPSTHTHTVANITNLQVSLNAKENKQYLGQYVKLASDLPLTYPKQQITHFFGRSGDGWPFPYCGVMTYSMHTNEAMIQYAYAL